MALEGPITYNRRTLRAHAPLGLNRAGLRPVLLASMLATTSALGRPHARRHFEPTDLALEMPGTTELDLETGIVRSRGPWRVITPDFELDLGLTPWLELDLDGSYAIEGAVDKPFNFDHSTREPLWPSVKLGVLDAVDEDQRRSYAAGAQLGPRLPVFGAGHGLGIEGLLLAGASFGETRLALNVGGFVDPAVVAEGKRPIGFQSGVNWERDLDRRGRYLFAAELAGVVFVSGEQAQLQASFGPSYAPSRWLRLSLTTLVGFTPGSDRYGILLGIAPRMPLWGPL
jgi:hypothetical protein